MIFNSFNFIVLFPVIFLLYYVIPAQYRKVRNLYLLLVSYLLYIQWKPVYALILLGVTTVTYLAALAVERTRRRKMVLVVGVLLALAPLTFFKYFNFINDNLSEILAWGGWETHLSGLNWAIPIGISFFTFQALGYLWDVYYRKQEAEHDFLIYALFVSFFPSILSGPINKASLVIPQLKRLRPYFDYGKAVEGLKMILWGMFAKVVVADRLSLFVDIVLPNYMHYTGMTCFCGQGAWFRTDREFPASLFRRQCHGFLAAVAYLALHMAEGLCVHPIGWKPMREMAQLLEHLCHVPCEWHLAWCQLDFRHLGVHAWGIPNRGEDAGTAEMQVWSNRQDHQDHHYIPAGQFRVDLFPDADLVRRLRCCRADF